MVCENCGGEPRDGQLSVRTSAWGSELRLCAPCLEDAQSDPGDYTTEADED